MDDFLNHTHPPLWATSLLREVNVANFLWIATPDFIRLAMTIQIHFCKPFLSSP